MASEIIMSIYLTARGLRFLTTPDYWRFVNLFDKYLVYINKKLKKITTDSEKLQTRGRICVVFVNENIFDVSFIVIHKYLKETNSRTCNSNRTCATQTEDVTKTEHVQLKKNTRNSKRTRVTQTEDVFK